MKNQVYDWDHLAVKYGSPAIYHYNQKTLEIVLVMDGYCDEYSRDISKMKGTWIEFPCRESAYCISDRARELFYGMLSEEGQLLASSYHGKGYYSFLKENGLYYTLKEAQEISDKEAFQKWVEEDMPDLRPFIDFNTTI